VPISAPDSSVTTQRLLGLDRAEFSRSRSGSVRDAEVALRLTSLSCTQSPLTLSLQVVKPGQFQVTCDTLRGFFYKLQSTTDLKQSFVDDPAGFSQALDSSIVQLESGAGPRKFYRAIRALAP